MSCTRTLQWSRLSRRRTLHTPSPDRVNTTSLSIASIHELLAAGSTSIVEVTRLHLDCIRKLNPLLNCITSLSVAALSTASSLDAQLRSGVISSSTHPLLGIPILLKDNFDVAGTPTTAGCRALAFNIATKDAAVVASLKQAGAVILGKTNMHELALEGLSVSSLAGQTRNPYDLARTPGGSSGGSGAAVAAGMCVLATGTDTVNSLRSPASACGVIGFRTTTGLVSTKGVQPVSWTQDVVGMIGRNVSDIAASLDVIKKAEGAGYGPASGQIPIPDAITEDNYTESLKPPAFQPHSTLSGKRLGLLESLMPSSSQPLDAESKPVADAMQKTISALSRAGAHIVPIADPTYSAERILQDLDTQRYEFSTAMAAYLQRQGCNATSPKTLHDLYASDAEYLVIPAQYEYITSALSPSFSPASPAYHAILARIASLKNHLRRTFDEHALDAAIYPQQKNLAVRIGAPSQRGRNGILAAVTGSPSICLPALSDATVPIGIEVLGLPWGERGLLRLAQEVEGVISSARTGSRRLLVSNATMGSRDSVEPVWDERGHGPDHLRAEMEAYIKEVTPSSTSVPAAYPLRRLA